MPSGVVCAVASAARRGSAKMVASTRSGQPQGFASERHGGGEGRGRGRPGRRSGSAGTGGAGRAVSLRDGGRTDAQRGGAQQRPRRHRALLEPHLPPAVRGSGARGGRPAAGQSGGAPGARSRVCGSARIGLAHRPGAAAARLARAAARRQRALGLLEPFSSQPRWQHAAGVVHGNRHHRAQDRRTDAAARRRQLPPVVRTLDRRHCAGARARDRRRQPGRGAAVPLRRQEQHGRPQLARFLAAGPAVGRSVDGARRRAGGADLQ